MNCIKCGYKTLCVDSRSSGKSVRRRHKCRRETCGLKFTTIETVVNKKHCNGKGIEDSFVEQIKASALEMVKKDLAEQVLNYLPSDDKFNVLYFGEIDAGKL